MADTETRAIILDGWREKLRLSKLFRWNSCLKHGIPIEKIDVDSPTIIIKEVPPEPQPTINEDKIVQQIQVSADKAVASLDGIKDKILPPIQPEILEVEKTSPWMSYALLILMAIVGLGGGYILNNMLGKSPQATEIKDEEPNTELSKESALQWLEDQGEHLP